MKKEKNKHNHCLTNLLKVSLFSLIMLMPFWVILIETLPYIFNNGTPLPTGSIYEQAITILLNNDLINWTTTTLLYSGIHAMFTQLHITSAILEEILTYWLMILSIYVVIDIVLTMFVFLTHWANERV